MRLYKYLSPNLVTVLENQMVRFSQPSVLNDPFELRPHISSAMSKSDMKKYAEDLLPNMIDEEYKKLSTKEKTLIPYKVFVKKMSGLLTHNNGAMIKLLTEQNPKISTRIFDEMDSSLGIFCLSEKPDSELMWSHYADSHQGFVLEFDSNSKFFNQKRSNADEFRHVRKVEYSDNRPSITLNEIKDFTPFLTKGSQWSYEAEWRIMFSLEDATQTIEQAQSNIHLFKFPHEALRSVIFGHRTKKVLRNQIIDAINSTPKFSHVCLREATIGTTDYKINISDI